MGRYKVTVGEEFEIDDVQAEAPESSEPKSDPKIVEMQHRNRLSMIVFGIATCFLLGATGVGLYEGDFSKLQAVHGVAMIPITAILTHYFGK